MRVPLSWLREWVEFPWDADELAERLTQAGLAVEAVERPGAEVEGVVLARILRVERHPRLPNLSVCTVDAGDRAAQVVTAAPNAVEGAWVVYARPGARLAGGTTIGVRDFQGVRSEGMLCAAWELGLPDAARTPEERLAAGILILPGDLPDRPGQDARPLLGLGDAVLVLDLTPNYAAHCQSILGVAREVAALAGTQVRVPPVPAAPVDPRPAWEAAAVAIEAPGDCRRYIARVIDGVTVGPSPLWLQRRLQLCGQRPINNVVDVTNYVMLETGQPLHGFDHARLAGGRIVVRRARDGERIVTLDGEERVLTADDLVIADAERPVAIAGVMGGADSEVEPSTRTVLLESAHFEPARVLRTSRRLGLRTEASLRFEKGLDPEAVALASERAAALIAAHGGGCVLTGCVDVVARPWRPHVIPFRPERINALLGTDLGAAEIADHLARYGFVVAGGQVRVPSYRTDVTGEADLAEEVARLYGYDRIPTQLPTGAPAAAGRPAHDRLLLAVRHLAVAAGFTEVTTFSFAAADLADRLQLADDHPQRRAIRLANPMGEEQATLRTTLLGSMLDVIAYNARRRVDAMALFELGTVYLPRAGGALPPTAGGGDAAGAGDGVGGGQRGRAADQALPDERQHLILAGTGSLRSRHWQKDAEPVDVFMLKGVLERMAARFGAGLEFRPASLPHLHPGRGAEVLLGERVIGYLGEVHPDVAARWDLSGRVSVAEIDVSAWLAAARPAAAFRELPRYPAVQRDVAFVVPLDVPAARAEAVIRAHAGEWLEDLVLFDVYQGEPIPAGHRSLAYALRYRAPDRTLTDEEVDAVHEGVRRALVRELGAVLR